LEIALFQIAFQGIEAGNAPYLLCYEHLTSSPPSTEGRL
jgi:hypothetical protein